MEQPWQKLFFIFLEEGHSLLISQQQDVIAMMILKIPPKKIMKIALHTHSSLFFFFSPSYFKPFLLWLCMCFPMFFFSGRWRWIAQIKTIHKRKDEYIHGNKLWQISTSGIFTHKKLHKKRTRLSFNMYYVRTAAEMRLDDNTTKLLLDNYIYFIPFSVCFYVCIFIS